MFTSTYIHRLAVLSLGLIISFSSPLNSFAADSSVNLQWSQNSESDLAGYNVYHGTNSGVYGFPDNVQNTTSHQKTNLDPTKNNYFAVTAYDNAGNESVPSAEVMKLATSVSTPPAPAPAPPTSGILINFQPSSSSIPSGYIKDDGSTYNATKGYGWNRSLTSFTRDRNTNSDQRLDTFVYNYESPATWNYNLPNGNYLVSLASGDPVHAWGGHNVTVEGKTAISNATTQTNQFKTVSDFPVTVTDGNLTVVLSRISGQNALLNYLSVRPAGTSPNLPQPAPAPAPAPPTSGILINFQPSSSPTPSGYIKDDGSTYNATKGYGWNRSLTGLTRDRNGNSDQRLDTFVYVDSGSPATWTYNLPNGNYLVSLASGDPDWAQGAHHVMVEGKTVINNVNTQTNQFKTISDVPVTVTDGNLTVVLSRKSGQNALLNYLSVRPAGTSPNLPQPPPAPAPPTSGILINFQPSSSPTPSGYIKDDGSPYTAARGYGWNRSLTNLTRDRNTNSDQRLDTFVYNFESPATWTYNLPNGNYLVSLASGDPDWAQGAHHVMVEGKTVINNVNTQTNQFKTISDVPVTVTDGNLTVVLSRKSGQNALLNYLSVRPAGTSPNLPQPAPAPAPPTSGIRINFQPSSSPTPSGYIKDDGSTYNATKGYGWNRSLTNLTRDRNTNSDQRLDTFVYNYESPATWTYNLPNGNYLVSLASGDPDWAQGAHHVMVEGKTVINNVNTQTNQFKTISDVPVTVTDGNLTVVLSRKSGQNSMLNYLSVRPAGTSPNLPQPPPAPAPAPAPPTSGIRINFQPSSSPTPSGYIKDDGSTYNATKGYGWNRLLTGLTRDRNANSDQRLDTFVFASGGSPATWTYDLPNGNYLVSFANGDASWYQGPHHIAVEGQTVVQHVPTQSNEFLAITDLSVTVSDGNLTIDMQTQGQHVMLNYINITPMP